MDKKSLWLRITITLSIISAIFITTTSSFAESRTELAIEVPATIQLFKREVKGGARFLARAAGYLVFPNVYKAGFIFGGEYGEGALVVGGRIVAYYNLVGASFGWQLGIQRRSVVVVFLTGKSLRDFRRSHGWQVGIDGSIAIAKWGVGEDINNIDFPEPVVGFIFDNQGLMGNLTLEGAKFTRIRK
ncbi:MAG: hypothetical protein GXO58_05270 [Thermodesulfobacteria bacterium]|nr:hypothetical protein [Thermodesulfobacteriota bacterium]